MIFFCPFGKKIKAQNKIFLRDFVVEMGIGVHDHEKGKTQRVVLNIEVVPLIWPEIGRDNIQDTVSYDDIVKIVEAVTAEKHTHLVETVAENIAQRCLSTLLIKSVKVRIEKPDIYGFAVPGAEIVRAR